MAKSKSKEDKKQDNAFLHDIIKGVGGKLGKNTIAMIEDGLPSDVTRFISTSSTLLDYAIANQKNGGVPVGKITEISGHEATGKTLVAMQICANAQKDNGLVIYIDPEHALNTDFAKRVGLNTEKDFLYLTPATMEDVFSAFFEIFHKFDEAKKTKTNFYDFAVIVWDSIPASPAKEDIDKENPNPTSNVGLVPRILSKNMKMLLEQSGRKNIAMLFLNQLRTRIGAMPGQDPYITTGGKALPYYCSVRIRLSAKGRIMNQAKDEVMGILTQGEVKKTRFGPPLRKTEFSIFFTKGIDDVESVIDFLKKKKGIKSKLGGSKGMQYWLPGVIEEENSLGKLALKTRILNDKSFREKLYDLVGDKMIRDLSDPDLELMEIVDN